MVNERIKPQRNERTKPQRFEGAEDATRGVYESDGVWYASVDGTERVRIDSAIAENIGIALDVQEKVDLALIGKHRPGFLRTIKMINCRKAAFAVLERYPLKKLLLGRGKLRHDASQEIVAQMSGVPELVADVGRILKDGTLPVLGTADNMQVAEYLDQHDTVPAIVHVFNIKKPHVNDILTKLVSPAVPLGWKDFMTKMNRDHTFLVLAKAPSGRYVCFHKRGSSEHHPFEVTYLDSVIRSAVEPKESRIYISVIGEALRDKPARLRTGANALNEAVA